MSLNSVGMSTRAARARVMAAPGGAPPLWVDVAAGAKSARRGAEPSARVQGQQQPAAAAAAEREVQQPKQKKAKKEVRKQERTEASSESAADEVQPKAK